MGPNIAAIPACGPIEKVFPASSTNLAEGALLIAQTQPANSISAPEERFAAMDDAKSNAIPILLFASYALSAAQASPPPSLRSPFATA